MSFATRVVPTFTLLVSTSFLFAIAQQSTSDPSGNIVPSSKERFDAMEKKAEATYDLIKYIQPTLANAQQTNPNAVFKLMNLRGSASSGLWRGVSFDYGGWTPLVEGFEVRFDFIGQGKHLGSEYYYADPKTFKARPAKNIFRYFTKTPENKSFTTLGVVLLYKEKSGRVVQLATTYSAW